MLAGIIVATGMTGLAGAEVTAGPPRASQADAACLGAGAAAYGYVHNAVDTGRIVSTGDVKAAFDYGSFAYCVAGSALTCGRLSAATTGVDYAAKVLGTGQFSGDNLRGLELGLSLDMIGYGLGAKFEAAADAAQKAYDEGSGPLAAVGNAVWSIPSVNLAPVFYVARGLVQAGADNFIKIVSYLQNYNIGTGTCANPVQAPSYCP